MWRLFTLLSFSIASNALAAESTPIPNFKLVNHLGRSLELHDLKGKYVLLSFVFTRCPISEMCPRTFSLSRDLIEKWKGLPTWRRTGFPIHVLAVTLDPNFDSPEIMKSKMEERGLDPDHFTFVTSDEKTLSELASEFNVVGIPSGGTISHNMKTILLSPLMVPIREFMDNEWTPEEVLNTIRKSIEWWRWFFFVSALLAVPGLYLVGRMRRMGAAHP